MFMSNVHPPAKSTLSMLGTGGRRVLVLASVAFLLAGTSLVASADSNVDAIVKERQDLMKKMGGTFKIIVPVVKEENTNIADAVPAAQTVNDLAKKIVTMFPPGSGRDATPETRAKPEVWSKRPEFEAAAEKLVEESAKLVEVAKTNDIEALRAQFKVYAAACGGCHEGPSKSGGKFRHEKE